MRRFTCGGKRWKRSPTSSMPQRLRQVAGAVQGRCAEEISPDSWCFDSVLLEEITFLRFALCRQLTRVCVGTSGCVCQLIFSIHDCQQKCKSLPSSCVMQDTDIRLQPTASFCSFLCATTSRKILCGKREVFNLGMITIMFEKSIC
ncbi:uncharacterized protein [Lolium perenne]|uniref:uncharacterized protein isoform X3 n=1 Tax=Lolium perenne TaxID=4522 RepID=UPI0021F52DC1|nr:uncharacterized protein LOC127294702 isoform X3 [Lolium perenne]XP_051180534.1 uncharacterized protein LOC127294702 isoform X3 [Lolium perenne]